MGTGVLLRLSLDFWSFDLFLFFLNGNRYLEKTHKGECYKQILLFLDSGWEVIKISGWPGKHEMFLEILHDHADFMFSCKFPVNFFKIILQS